MDKDFKKIFDKLSGAESEAQKVLCVMRKYQEYLDLLVEKGILTVQDTRMKFFVENQEILSLLKEESKEEPDEEEETEDDDADEEPEDCGYKTFTFTSKISPETSEEKAIREQLEKLAEAIRSDHRPCHGFIYFDNDDWKPFRF